MKKRKTWLAALICILVLTLLCGLVYPLIMTAASQLIFPEQANGSVLTVTKDGKTQTVGSALIGQSWTEPKYLIGRPNSGAPTNQSAVSEEQKQTVAEYVKWWNEFDPETRGKDIPEDLLTASGSGVDPEISPKAAEFQVERIARVRKVPESSVRKLIDKYTTGKTFGFLGENRVNVLLVNLELDGYKVEQAS
ncbi:potassium-transporting ATPase subunit C [[Clostridium] innocuum]|nr:potassium-transporting ATPase subunit C [[Clostridium] innocuum]